MGLFTKIFGTRSQREIKQIQPLVDKILSMEGEYAALSEEALKGKTAQFKDRLSKGETLDDLLPEAFAAVREAAGPDVDLLIEGHGRFDVPTGIRIAQEL